MERYKTYENKKHNINSPNLYDLIITICFNNEHNI